MARTLLRALCLLLVGFAIAPQTTAAQGARAFSVFIDCSDFYCDPDFYRTDITFVDHVRERTAADVHVLITQQPPGGGGTACTLADREASQLLEIARGAAIAGTP